MNLYLMHFQILLCIASLPRLSREANGASSMSLIHEWRTWNSKVKSLEGELSIMLQENRILLEEIKMLKKLVYDLEIEYTTLIHRK